MTGSASENALGRVILAIGRRLMPRELKGTLKLTLPSGRTLHLGTPGTGVDADLALDNWRPVLASVARASVGFAETYFDGHWQSGDPAKVIRFYLQNRKPLDGAGSRVFFQNIFDRLWHLNRDNTKRGARRNISEHYDLGNAFYGQWLDPSMTYSSGFYRRADQTLEESQEEKYRLILDALGVEQGHDVLEIGCGWGGFAEAAGRAGARVRAITLSEEQRAYAAARLTRAGLGRDCEVHLEDYRDTKGAFDRIASIEMIEAVGEARWPHYFATVRERLKPGGVAVIQAITIAQHRFARYRRKADMIQRYVFPGGMLPTVDIMRAEAGAQGLVVDHQEHFGESYARTLRDWRERFDARWPAIVPLGFDTRFRRLWRYYLAYCEAGFAEEALNVGIYRLRRPL